MELEHCCLDRAEEGGWSQGDKVIARFNDSSFERARCHLVIAHGPESCSAAVLGAVCHPERLEFSYHVCRSETWGQQHDVCVWVLLLDAFSQVVDHGFRCRVNRSVR